MGPEISEVRFEWEKSMKKLLLGFMIMFGTLVPVAVSAPAQAVGCYGDYCSGKDPQSTGCSADAITFASNNVYGTGYTIELRWSPTCKTEWARISAGGWTSGVDSLGVVQPSTGYQQWGVAGSNATYKWSKMIYSPVRCVYARWVKPAWATTDTACV